MNKLCGNCGTSFEVTAGDLAFYEKLDVPAPTHCYFCRMQRRLAHRNERHLYHRKCHLSGKQIISSSSPDQKYPVYDLDVWWSDKYDPITYGADYDPALPFFEQFLSLRNRVPRLALQQQLPMENSQYCNCASKNKNCYLVFSTNRCEDCYYGSWVNDSRDCVDNLNIEACELCYECVGCRNCYSCRYLRDCISCRDSLFLRDCINCHHCIGCTSLSNQSYCIFNKNVGQKQYAEFVAQLDLGSRSRIEELHLQIERALGVTLVKEYHGHANENSCGDYISHCRNCQCCFECDECEDLSYCMCVQGAKSSMDHSYWGVRSELIYECQACGYDLYHLRFCNLCWANCADLDYCDHCFSSKCCFGCVGLKKNEYCILNRQYNKTDFEELRAKIIADMKKRKEWGEFFPIALSPFSYNESLAAEHMPLSRAEVEKRGWHWQTADETKGNDYIGPRVAVPDNIAQVDNGIMKQILRCVQSGRPYKLVEPEFKFYKKMSIPVPVVCSDVRHNQRLQLRNPRILWTRQCDSCTREIRTTYASARPEKVLCEECYQEKVLA